MFSFRFDKAGFFSGLTLMILLGGTVLATILIFAIGGWNDFTILVWKWVVGTVWVLCIITVLVRVAIYRYQMLHGVNPHKRDGPPRQNPDQPDVHLPPDASDRREGPSQQNPEEPDGHLPPDASDNRDGPPRQNPEEPDGQRPPETSEMSSRERDSS